MQITFSPMSFATRSGIVSAALTVLAALASGCGPAYPNCETDANCKAKGEYCVDTKCAQCRLDSHCPGAGTDVCVTCAGGACGRKADCCNSKLDCGTGKQCQANRCIAECTGDVQCPAGQKCVAGTCTLPATSSNEGGACSSDKDCGGGKCVKGKCVGGGGGDCDKLSAAYFDFNEYTLSSSTQSALSATAKCLKERNISSVTIEGHCDERGTDAYNMELGNRRARAVKEYLKTVAPKVGAKTISYGKTKPVCNEDSESCWSQNRRAEFRAKGK